MLANFLTKPLQGSLFRKFRDVILGYTHVSSLSPSASPDVERVEGNRENPESRVTGQTVTWCDVAKRSEKESLASTDEDLVEQSSHSVKQTKQ